LKLGAMLDRICRRIFDGHLAINKIRNHAAPFAKQ